MTFIEFIGFIITMLALFFLMMKRALEEKKRRENPEKYAEEEKKKQDAYRKFLKSLDVEIAEEEEEDEEVVEERPPPPPEEREDIPQILEGIQPATVYIEPHDMLTRNKREVPSRVKSILKEGTLKDAILLREILGPPKSQQ